MPDSLFKRDALRLVEASRENPGVIFRIIIMTLLSIRQPWYRVPEQFDDVFGRGRNSSYLFGFKRAGYDYAYNNMAHLHGAVKNYDGNLERLIVEFMKVPGLGLAKASFVAQMTVGDGACLDSHNLRRIGLDASFTRLDKSRPEEVLCDRVAIYNEFWTKYGDSSYWWDTWCEALASSNPNRYSSADEVSAIHLLPLLQEEPR